MTIETLEERLPDTLPDDPVHWLERWLDCAVASQVQRNPNSMTLVTSTPDGHPSARVVLCKALAADPGFVVFYTNYQSRKCREIEANPNVAATFHWDALGRQVRIEGIALRSPDSESDAYFATRDRGSQIGAWGSDQSRTIASRRALLDQVEQRAHEIARGSAPVPRPPHWGGIRVWAAAIELWIEGTSRVHDRARWERTLTPASADSFSATPWVGSRLQP